MVSDPNDRLQGDTDPFEPEKPSAADETRRIEESNENLFEDISRGTNETSQNQDNSLFDQNNGFASDPDTASQKENTFTPIVPLIKPEPSQASFGAPFSAATPSATTAGEVRVAASAKVSGSKKSVSVWDRIKKNAADAAAAVKRSFKKKKNAAKKPLNVTGIDSNADRNADLSDVSPDSVGESLSLMAAAPAKSENGQKRGKGSVGAASGGKPPRPLWMRVVAAIGTTVYTFFSFLLKTLGTMILIGVVAGSIMGVAGTIYVTRYIDDSIDFDLTLLKLDLTSYIYVYDDGAEDWVVARKLYKSQNRIWVDMSDIPTDLLDAVKAVEDKRFDTHHGVDWIRTASAMLSMGGSGGGSTLTQQLIKNITGDDDVKILRKIQEIFRALNLETMYSKDTILESYLNVIYLGQSCNGMGMAAQVYFRKDVSELNLAECALLAGLIQSPEGYNPLRHPDLAKNRQKIVLTLMLEQGKITKEQYDEAFAYELIYSNMMDNEPETEASETPEEQTEPDDLSYKLPTNAVYYIDQVIEDVIADLRAKNDWTYSEAEKYLYSGGLHVYAAVDLSLQKIVEDVFCDDSYFFADAETGAMPEASMTIIDPNTGIVMAMVGGRGEKTNIRGLNRATQSYRGPGSTIKPISVYAPALEHGYINPFTVLDDSPVNIKDQWPQNENRRYSGLMTVREAIRISANTIAARTLSAIGTEISYKFMTENLHFTSLTEEDKLYDAPLSLGALTKGTNTYEMTAAYVPFANGGIYMEPYTYTRVEDSSGKTLLENNTVQSLAMSADTAWLMTEMLQNVVRNGTGTNARLSNRSIPVAGKTGTTSSNTDRWFMGYTPYYVGGVWYGFDTRTTITASPSPAVRIWQAVMDKVHAELPAAEFPEKPNNIVEVEYCLDSGLLCGPYCDLDIRGPRRATGYCKAENAPTVECNMHTPVLVDITTDQIISEYCPPALQATRAFLNMIRVYPYEIAIGDSEYSYLQADEPVNAVTQRRQIEGLLITNPFIGQIGDMPLQADVGNGEVFLPDHSVASFNQPCADHTVPPEPEPEPGFEEGEGGEEGNIPEPEPEPETPEDPLIPAA